MAISSIGTLGARNFTVSAAVFSYVTQTTTVNPGNLVVLVMASDNTCVGADHLADVTQVGSIEDTQNTWTRMAEKSGGVAGSATLDQAVAIIWTTIASATMTVGRTISISMSSAALVGALCVTGWVYDIGAGSTIEHVDSTATGTLNLISFPDPHGLDLTTANAEHLRIRVHAIEAGNTGGPQLAADASWTLFDPTVAINTGGSTNSIMLGGEWRIVTGTNADTSATCTGNNPGIIMYSALKEVGGGGGDVIMIYGTNAIVGAIN